MTCFYMTTDKTVQPDEPLEKKIYAIMEKYCLAIGREVGLQARNDGGIDDVHYSTGYHELSFENFIVDDKKVIGYVQDGHAVSFTGKEKHYVEIYEIDETDHSGWNDYVDITSYRIEPKRQNKA